MSFTIRIGTNRSEANRLTKDVSYTQSLEGSLKNETDITTPVIFVEGLANIGNINYMRIDEFGRSYFVEDIRIIRDNLFEIQARCDVLSSFASQIRANNAIIKKQENKFNLYLDDGSLKAYQNSNIGILNFSGDGFGTGQSNASYVLAVAGE